MHLKSHRPKTLLLITFVFILLNVKGQTGLNFQGVARTNNNVILASQPITLKLSILQGNSNGTIEYVETRKVFTNTQGLFTAVIGDTGTISSLGNFSTINWKLTPKYLKIEMDPSAGSNFTIMGITQFQYVAYAQFANSVAAENINGIIPVSKGGTGSSNFADLKNSLQLNNVNNTSDLLKPISTATQSILDIKLNKADTAFLLQKTDTSSISNRINLKANSTDITNGLALKENITNKSIANDLGGTNPSDLLYPSQKAVKEYVLANNAAGGIADGAITTIKLANASVTDSKINTVSGSKVIGNISGNAATASLSGNITATSNTTLTSLSNLSTVGTITSGVWSATLIAINNGGTGTNSAAANMFFAGPDGSSGAPLFRAIAVNDLPTNSNSYIQNAPITQQSGAINIDGSASFGNSLNVHGIYLGIGHTNQNNTNTFLGNQSSQGNNDGYQNSTLGIWTLQNNNGGIDNTAMGAYSLKSNSTGNDNTAIGNNAMINNTTGNYNTATGSGALSSNTSTPNTGNYNVSNGYLAIPFNTTGSNNVGIGYYALQANRTGNYNTAIGNGANVGSGALINATAIGNGAIVSTSNTIQLGNTNVTSINTTGAITAAGFSGPLNGNATSATIAGNITATSNSTLTTLSNLSSVGILNNATVNGKIIVGSISATSSSAVLEVNSNTQGFLPPRMNYYQRTQIISPVAGLTIWCNNCGSSGEMQVFNGASWTNMIGGTSTGTINLSIGQNYQGGIVAYILQAGDPGYDANTQHGLIAATSDQSTYSWWYDHSLTPFPITNATGTGIGTGLSNTNTIISVQGLPSNGYSAGTARAYNGGGYSDWYLPSKDELSKLYALSLLGYGNFDNQAYYWSSSEYDTNRAWFQIFSNGTQNAFSKFNPLNIRVVRSF